LGDLGLRVLGLGVLGFGVWGGLRIELGLLTKLVEQSLSRVFAEATGDKLRFEALFF